MHLKKLIAHCVFMCCALLYFGNASAQSRISGTVKNTGGVLLPGVSIAIKGTSKGTVTDNNGRFVLDTKKGDVLLVSYLGFLSQEVPADDKQELDLTLHQNEKSLSEVVVTALGIKREKQAIGYAVQEVKGSELVKAREPNVINSLAGKVSGLRIATSTNLFGDPGIALRGRGTIIVIDGVVVRSDSWNLSADDIESFSVLKGPTAAALYGSQGINGAIQITTKRGSRNKRGFSVEVNSSTQIQNGFVARPKLQTEYGPGSDFRYAFVDGKGGGINDADYDIWGPRFEGQPITQYDSKVDPSTGKLIPQPWIARGTNNLNNFLQKGILSSNNVAISANNDKGDIRFSLTQLYQRGLVPNTKLGSTNMNMSGGLNISNKLRLETNINYSKQYTPNYPNVSYQPSSPIYTLMIWGAADYDVRDLRNYWVPGKEGIQQRAPEIFQYTNPYLSAYEQLRGYYKDDIYGYAKLKYNVTSNLDIHLRSNISTFTLNRTNRYPISGSWRNQDGGYFLKGGYNESYEQYWENNTDVLATYTKNLSTDLSLKASAGANLRTTKSNYLYGHTNNGLLVPQLWTVQNSVDPPTTSTSKSLRQTKSVYAYADLDYRRMLFLSLTGRMDQSSTLPKGHNTYFYPSASLSAIVTEMAKFPQAISFWKLRASVAKVGKDNDDPYSLYPTYSTGGRWDNMPSLYYDGTLYNPNIRPEFNTSTEFGTDIRFLDNRIGLDLTYFRNIEGPSIFYLPLSGTSGASSLQRNGLTYLRKGVEIVLTASPIRTKNFSWDVMVNWSMQQRYLKEIYDTLKVYSRVKIGERTDKVYLTDYQKSPDGQIIFNAANGRPLYNSYVTMQGYSNNKWIASLQNTVRYKDVTLSFMLDGRYGGVLVNYLNQKQWQAGAHPESANEFRLADWNNRNTAGYKGTKIGDGVVITSGSLQVDGDGNVVSDTRKFASNTTPVKWESYAKAFYGSDIANLVDKTYLKLRELSITYAVPQRLLQRQKLFNSASVSLVGRNLWYWAKDKKARNIDLDQWTNSSTDLETPSVKSYGLNINLVF